MPSASYSRDQVEAALNPVLSDLTRIVDEGVKTGLLRPAERTVERWTPEDFSVKDGVPSFSRQGSEYVKVRSWDPAITAVVNLAEKLPSRKTAGEKVEFRMAGWRDLVEWFLIAATKELLEDSTRPCPGGTQRLEEAVQAAGGVPVVLRGDLEFTGIRILGGPLALKSPRATFSLATPSLQDMIVDVEPFGPKFGPSPGLGGPGKSAVGWIEMADSSMGTLQEEARMLVVALRLFRPCSAAFHAMDFKLVAPLRSQEGVLRMGGSYGQTLESATLSDSDTPDLQRFITAVHPVLLRTGLDAPRIKPGSGPVDIAYLRYSDSLTSDAGLIERRFAHAVMGLEALYLRGGAEGELSSRLRTSIAQVMESFGEDGRIVADEVRFAYGVRSAHVHGSALTRRETQRAEKRYGGLQPLLGRLIDRLRISILIHLFTGMPKDQFLKLVEDSTNSEYGRKALKEVLSSVGQNIPRT